MEWFEFGVSGFRAHVYGGRRNHLDIALTLSGSRPIAMLRSQLKLHTVVEVALQEQAAVRSVSA